MIKKQKILYGKPCKHAKTRNTHRHTSTQIKQTRITTNVKLKKSKTIETKKTNKKKIN